MKTLKFSHSNPRGYEQAVRSHAQMNIHLGHAMPAGPARRLDPATVVATPPRRGYAFAQPTARVAR